MSTLETDTRVVLSTGFALRHVRSSLDNWSRRADAKRCAEPGVPAKSRWWGADFVGWEGAPDVPDRGGVLEGGACPPLH
jgi:hypothetical protein